MSDQNNKSMTTEQILPKIEDEILELLDSDLKERSLGFAAYLRENQLTPQPWFGPGFWRVTYEQHYLCGIHLDKNRWRFWFWSGDYNNKLNEKFIEAALDHVRPCINCTTDCQFGKDTTVFGREFINTCIQFPIQFENPDNSTLECIKELLEYWKTAAPNSYSWHYRD